MTPRILGLACCLSILVVGLTLGQALEQARAPRVTVSAEVARPLRAVDLPRLPVQDTGGWHTVIPSGMRAIAVDVQEGPVLARMVEPGAVVDLLGTVPGEDGTRSGTVLNQVLVLGVTVVDDTAQLTVLVDPRQAEWVALVSQGGAARVALHADDERVQLHPAARRRLQRRLERAARDDSPPEPEVP